jgi:hypothetical protein
MSRHVIAVTGDVWDEALEHGPLRVRGNAMMVGDISSTILQRPTLRIEANATLDALARSITIDGADATIADFVRIVDAERIRFLSADLAEIGEAYARQVLVIGGNRQKILSKLTVAVVGAGGTGSAVFELLVRLGVGRIILVDDDIVEATNVTRIHGSTLSDVGRAKVEVLRDYAERIGLGTVVETIRSKVTSATPLTALRHTDVVFSCTDDHAGRSFLSRLAYRYLIPLFDCGVQIDVDDDGVIDGIHGAVIAAGPGLPCLQCSGQVEADQVQAEMMPADEREARAREGYVPGIGGATPAVITYTTAVASLVVSEFVHRIIGLTGSAENQLVVFDRHKINSRERHQHERHYCADPTYVGGGDCEPFLGVVWP